MRNPRVLLGLGDLCVTALVTFAGFVSHGEAALSFLPRLLITLLPLTAGWFLLAPWFGLFNLKIISSPGQFWRVWVVMLFVAPLAGLIRAALLIENAIPVFVLVLGTTSALGLSVWRLIFSLLKRKNKPNP